MLCAWMCAYVCVHEYVRVCLNALSCVYVGACSHACIHMQRTEVDIRWDIWYQLISILTFWGRVSPWMWRLPFCIGWKASKPQESSCPHVPQHTLSALELLACATMPSFLVNAGIWILVLMLAQQVFDSPNQLVRPQGQVWWQEQIYFLLKRWPHTVLLRLVPAKLLGTNSPVHQFGFMKVFASQSALESFPKLRSSPPHETAPSKDNTYQPFVPYSMPAVPVGPPARTEMRQLHRALRSREKPLIQKWRI